MSARVIDGEKYSRDDPGDEMISEALRLLEPPLVDTSSERTMRASSFPDEPECASVRYLIRGKGAHDKALLVEAVVNAMLMYHVEDES